VTRLSGGHYRSFELRTFLAPSHKQNNSSDQRQPAEYWWNRNVLSFFRGSVDGPEIKNLFLMGITESLIGEGQAAQNN